MLLRFDCSHADCSRVLAVCRAAQHRRRLPAAARPPHHQHGALLHVQEETRWVLISNTQTLMFLPSQTQLWSNKCTNLVPILYLLVFVIFDNVLN